MQNVNLVPFLALPLVGGYAFATIWTGSLYFSAREKGHRLYLRSIFYAVIMIVWASLLHMFLFTQSPTYLSILLFAGDVLNTGGTSENLLFWGDSSKLTILVLSFVLGPTVGWLLNFPQIHNTIINVTIPCTRFRPFYWWVMLVLKRAIKNNDLERLIMRGVEKNTPILFTLNTGKVYVGWAVRAPNPTQERKSVRILPLLSGYRDVETQELFFTTDYFEILSGISEGEERFDHLEIGDLEVVLPTSEICGCHLFDTFAYSHFAEQQDIQQE